MDAIARDMKLVRFAAALVVLACAPGRRDAAQGSPDSHAAAPLEAQPADAGEAASSCASRIITGAGIGALRVGATVDSVRASCAVIHDSVEIRAEGMPARIIDVALGADTIEAEVVDGRIWRITIDRPGLTTADSLRVGSPLSRLLEHHGAHGAVGEGKLFVLLPDRCGLSFRLAARPGDVARSSYDESGLRALPSTIVVDQLLITGCSTQD
jgi:hypothetical protein